MRGAHNWTIDDMANSFALWWRDAGLHSATAEAPFDWRAPPKARAVAPDASANAPVALAERPAHRPVPDATPAASPASRPAPNDLASFREWLASDPTQPESAWTGQLCLPPALAGTRLLILADMPDDSFAEADRPFAPERLRFIGAMLAAIGLSLDDAGFAPLALRRPPGGLLDEANFTALSGRMRHYLALARPQAALILGDRTARALGADQAGRLSRITLDRLALSTAALPNPDLLMRRPAAKAASWQTLRHLRDILTA